MGRRRFDHLAIEVSLAVGCRIPRYELWLSMHDHGCNPEGLSRENALSFCGAPLVAFLADRGWLLSERRLRRIQRAVRRYDPSVPSPYERLARA